MSWPNEDRRSAPSAQETGPNQQIAIHIFIPFFVLLQEEKSKEEEPPQAAADEEPEYDTPAEIQQHMPEIRESIEPEVRP